MMPGGTTEARAPSTDEQNLLQQIRADVEKETGRKFSHFEVTHVKTQVVAGTNYFAKIKVEADEYIHVRVWQTLQQTLELNGVLQGKALNDTLEYFQA